VGHSNIFIAHRSYWWSEANLKVLQGLTYSMV
jgi:hypothetical protein